MIPGDLLSAFPYRQFNTLPGLLDSWAALPYSNPNACMPMQEGSLYYFYDGFWYDLAERRTHDLPCKRRTRYRLSQPTIVYMIGEVELTAFCCVAGKKFGRKPAKKEKAALLFNSFTVTLCIVIYVYL